MLHLATILAVLSCSFAHQAGPAPQEEVVVSQEVRTRTLFERYASELPYLSLDAVLWDREEHMHSRSIPPQFLEQHTRILRPVTDPVHPMPALFALLTHPSPKVRTLAAVALFDRNDPRVLPRLYELRKDAAVSFEMHMKPTVHGESPNGARGSIFPVESGIMVPQGTLTVGGLASAMLRFYMQDCFSSGDFPKYWELHGERGSCVCWFEVQARRAFEGQTPLPEGCAEKLAVLRERIEALEPEPEPRLWIWLALWSQYGNRGTQENGSPAPLVGA